jgi:hypothetical protein
MTLMSLDNCTVRSRMTARLRGSGDDVSGGDTRQAGVGAVGEGVAGGAGP